jgi:hypothetical protein
MTQASKGHFAGWGMLRYTRQLLRANEHLEDDLSHSPRQVLLIPAAA